MKSECSSSAIGSWVLRHPIENTKQTIFHLPPLVVLAVALTFAILPAKAQTITNSLLVNPSFDNANSGNAIPTGWTFFAPPNTVSKDYWINNAAGANDGNVEKMDAEGNPNGYWWKQWNALDNALKPTNNVAGIYQTFGSAPTSVYQANAWMTSSAGDEVPSASDISWVQVEFLDANSNLLSLYKSTPYNINDGVTTWFEFQVTNACDITQPVPTGDPYFTTYAVTGAVSQLVAPTGTVRVRYRLCDYFNVGDGGSLYFDDAAFQLVSGPPPPVISDLNPQNEIFVPPSSGLSFNATSPNGLTINNSGIQVTLNGSNVSSSLVISGTASSKNVTYNNLQSNATYNATITVTDTSGLQSSVNSFFETTWVGVPAYTYLWEAEDFDFSGGMFINDPDLCNEAGTDTNCYFGQVGENNVDEFSTGTPPAQFYRGASDGIGVQPSGDYSRPNLTTADRVDYCINPFNSTEWVNYTRNWPASTNWIIGRFANGGTAGGDSLSLITPTSTNLLGNFEVSTTPSWSTFGFFYLISTDGVNRAAVVLNGKETLQLTAGYNGVANALPTFFMIVPGVTDLPILTGLYPDGNHPFESTNTLSFTVTTAGATFPTNGIQVILDGINVSSDLIIKGSSSSNNVVYPLATNEAYSVTITATNSLGHGIAVSYQFDTFNPNNYIFQAEDYDFNGGQFVLSANYQPDCYQSYSSVTNVDYHHTYVGEPSDVYPYRQDGIPQALTADTSDFYGPFASDQFAFDYNLNWYGGGDWVNYTRDYPPGAYNVFARTAGVGSYSMNFGRVTRGWGTTNQAVQPLGQFSSSGSDESTFSWVPLTDSGGVAPVTVNVNGPTNTFQVLTPTGNCYPNYFMLVPASPVHMSATRSGANVNISFAAQTGSIYRLFYRTNLTSGSWTLLNTVLGNAPVQSVTDPAPADRVRFYKVTSP